MSLAFSRTLRSLKADGFRTSITAIAVVIIFIALWTVWLMFGDISVYAVSNSARLEAERAIHPIQSLYAGRIVTNHLVLGQAVKRGDVLIELDATVQRLELVEERTQSESTDAEISKLHQEIQTEELGSRNEEAAAQIGVREAQAKLQEAQATASYAILQAERTSQLHKAGLVSDLDLARMNSEAQKQRATVESLRIAITRLEREQDTRSSDRRARIEGLRRDLSRLVGQRTKSGVTIDRLQSEMELRRIVAPVDGRIGEVGTLRIGAVIAPGEKLGAILPTGDVKVVAQFQPAEALGRIRTGQRARVRLDGFPWAQYGTVSAVVANVANEVRDGYVRVELNAIPGTRIHLEHGLPGTAEIEVENLSPGALLVRTAGQTLTPERPQAASRLGASQ
jgi:membrane fusion protein (multidrug efflux system)